MKRGKGLAGRVMKMGKSVGVPLRFSKRTESICCRTEPSNILSEAAEGSNCALAGLNKKIRLAAVRAII